MNIQELIKEIEENGIYCLNVFGNEVKSIPVKRAIGLIEQLNEPKRVKVPQEIADEIEYYKKNDGYGLFCAMDDCYEKHKDWFNRNEETFARAWLDGYEVEEEKRYTVKLTITKQYLYRRDNDFTFVTYTRPDDNPTLCHTRKELEEANFGWVFDCPGIEIEEVEG